MYKTSSMWNDLEYVPSLLEIAAESAGRCIEPMVIVQSTLDESLFTKVLKHAFPRNSSAVLFMQTFSTKEGEYDETNIRKIAGNLDNIRQIGFMLITVFNEEDKTLPKIRVKIEFAKQEITSITCSKCNRSHGCIHAFVACLLRTIEWHDVRTSDIYHDVKIEPPLTDTLWPMDKAKLEKLLYKTIAKDPVHIIDLIQQCAVEDDADENENIHDPTVSCRLTEETFAELAVERYLHETEVEMKKTVASYNWELQWKLENHIKRAVELRRVNFGSPLPLLYFTAVGRNVLDIAKALSGKQSDSHLGASGLFLHDLRMCGAYIFPQRIILDATFIDNIDVDMWKLVVNKCQQYYESCLTHEYPTYILPCSPWVELPRIYPLYADKVKEVFGLDNEDGFLSEALASLFIPPSADMFDDFNFLVMGGHSPLDCKYDEPLAVMMVRANAYKFNEPLDRAGETYSAKRKRFAHCNKIYESEQLRLVDRILVRLAKIGLKYSILSVVGKHINIDNDELISEKHFLKFIIEQSKDIDLTKSATSHSQEPNDQSTSTLNQTLKPENSPGTKLRAGDNVQLKEERKHEAKDREELAVEEQRVHEMVEERTLRIEKERKRKLQEKKDRAYAVYRMKVETVYPTYNVTERYVSPDALAPGFGLTKGQLAYCLLYWLIRRGELMEGYHKRYRDWIMEDVTKGIHFLALELARYSITTKRKTIYSPELRLLENMERKVHELAYRYCEGNEIHLRAFEYTSWLYVSAWWHMGFEFYGDNIPFVLGNSVFSRGVIINQNDMHNEFAYFGMDGQKKIRERMFNYMMCAFIMLEHKALYRFNRKSLGPYPCMGYRGSRPPPLLDTYNGLIAVLFDQVFNDTPDKFILSHIEEVLLSCFKTSIKTIPYTLWRALKRRMYGTSLLEIRQALRGVHHFDEDTEDEDILMLKISLHLCDLHGGQPHGMPNWSIDKYCQTIVATCKTLGADRFDKIHHLFKEKTWGRYITYVHMESILEHIEICPYVHLQAKFYGYVLDICLMRQKVPNLEKEYIGIKPWQGILNFKFTVSTLLGVYRPTGTICTDVLAFLKEQQDFLAKCVDPSELVLKALSVLACHKECEACRSLLFAPLKDTELAAEQIVTIIEEVLSCTPSQHAETIGLYTLLEKFKTVNTSDSLSVQLFSNKMVSWILENTACKLRNSMDLDGDVVALIQAEYSLFLDNVEMDETQKNAIFKEMIEETRTKEWIDKRNSMWTRSLLDTIDAILH